MADTATWHLVRQGQEGPFVVEGDVIVGRSKEADLRIGEGFVSRRHARLWLEDDRLMVEDLSSANGTFVNGVRISSRARLDPGDRVSFDETEYHVEQVRIPVDPDATALRSGGTPTAADAPVNLSMSNARPATETGQPAERPASTVIMSPGEAPGHSPPPPEPAPAPTPSGSGETVGLLGLSGPVERQLYQLAEGRVSIGRSPESDILIDEGSISKRHAELRVQPGNCRIHAVSSSNGVFVNGTEVDEVALNPGDVIRLGRIEMMFDSHERLLGTSAGGGDLPPWVWMIVGFVGAGAILAIVAWLLL